MIVPCRNERDRISQCLESILQNDYPCKLEIIVVDGMSDDGTRRIFHGIKVTCRSSAVLGAGHIPRIGETICYHGRDYRVSEVTWDFGEDRVFIGRRF